MSHTSRAIVPLIAVPDVEDLGPAMAACNIGERAWVIAKIETGESNLECARLAGYSASTEDVLKSTGYQIAHRQRVQDALLEMSRKLMRTEGAKSIRTLVAIRDDKTIKSETRLKASVELLDRAGMSAVSESHLTVTHELSDAQLDQRILALAAELGLPAEAARKLLISPADKKNSEIIDADFTEVETLSPEEQARRDHANEQRRKVRAMSPEERSAHIAAQRKQHSENLKAKRAAHEAQRLLALGRAGLEDLLETNMSSDDVLDRDFLTSLQGEYRHVRKYRVDHLLNVAGSDTFDAETRRHYLDAALAFDPSGMAATLHDIICRETSATADRIAAATLYLYGGDKGFWQIAPPAAERALSLLASEKEKPMKPTKARAFSTATRARKDDVRLYSAIGEAGVRMEASLKDLATTDEAKLEAIARFFRVVGCLAPDELDASLRKAAAELNLTHNQGVH